MSIIYRTLKNLSWSLSNQIYRAAILFFRIAILTNFLRKEDFALVAIANLCIGFVALFQDMGFSVGILHKQAITIKEYSSLFVFNLLLGLILCLLICALSYPISVYYNEPELIPIVCLLSISVLFFSLGNQNQTVLQKQHRFKIIALVDFFGLTINFLVAYALAHNGYGVYAIVYSLILYSFVNNCIFLFWGIFINKHLSLYFRYSLIKPFFKIGLYQMGSKFVDYFVIQLDILFISSNYSKADLGLYSLCKNFVKMIYQFTAPLINMVLTPVFAEIQDNKALINLKIYDIIKILAAVLTPVFLIPAFFSETILHIVYGESYIDGKYILLFLLLSYVLMPVSSVIASLNLAYGKTHLSLRWTIVLAIIITTYYSLGVNFNLGLNQLTAFYFLVSLLNTFGFWFIQVRRVTAFSYVKYIKNQLFYLLLFFVLFCLPYYYFQNNSNDIHKLVTSLPLFMLYILITFKILRKNNLFKKMISPFMVIIPKDLKK